MSHLLDALDSSTTTTSQEPWEKGVCSDILSFIELTNGQSKIAHRMDLEPGFLQNFILGKKDYKFSSEDIEYINEHAEDGDDNAIRKLYDYMFLSNLKSPLVDRYHNAYSSCITNEKFIEYFRPMDDNILQNCVKAYRDKPDCQNIDEGTIEDICMISRILRLVDSHRRTCRRLYIHSPTGSGKTTKLREAIATCVGKDIIKHLQDNNLFRYNYNCREKKLSFPEDLPGFLKTQGQAIYTMFGQKIVILTQRINFAKDMKKKLDREISEILPGLFCEGMKTNPIEGANFHEVLTKMILDEFGGSLISSYLEETDETFVLNSDTFNRRPIHIISFQSFVRRYRETPKTIDCRTIVNGKVLSGTSYPVNVKTLIIDEIESHEAPFAKTMRQTGQAFFMIIEKLMQRCNLIAIDAGLTLQTFFMYEVLACQARSEILSTYYDKLSVILDRLQGRVPNSIMFEVDVIMDSHGRLNSENTTRQRLMTAGYSQMRVDALTQFIAEKSDLPKGKRRVIQENYRFGIDVEGMMSVFEETYPRQRREIPLQDILHEGVYYDFNFGILVLEDYKQKVKDSMISSFINYEGNNDEEEEEISDSDDETTTYGRVKSITDIHLPRKLEYLSKKTNNIFKCSITEIMLLIDNEIEDMTLRSPDDRQQLIIYCTSKQFLHGFMQIVAYRYYTSIRREYDEYEDFVKDKVLLVDADSDEQVIERVFSRTNQVFHDYDLIGYTGSMPPGASYENRRPARVFAILTGLTNRQDGVSSFDVYQLIMRTRYPSLIAITDIAGRNNYTNMQIWAIGAQKTGSTGQVSRIGSILDPSHTRTSGNSVLSSLYKEHRYVEMKSVLSYIAQAIQGGMGFRLPESVRDLIRVDYRLDVFDEREKTYIEKEITIDFFYLVSAYHIFMKNNVNHSFFTHHLEYLCKRNGQNMYTFKEGVDIYKSMDNITDSCFEDISMADDQDDKHERKKILAQFFYTIPRGGTCYTTALNDEKRMISNKLLKSYINDIGKEIGMNEQKNTIISCFEETKERLERRFANTVTPPSSLEEEEEPEEEPEEEEEEEGVVGEKRKRCDSQILVTACRDIPTPFPKKTTEMMEKEKREYRGIVNNLGKHIVYIDDRYKRMAENMDGEEFVRVTDRMVEYGFIEWVQNVLHRSTIPPFLLPEAEKFYRQSNQNEIRTTTIQTPVGEDGIYEDMSFTSIQPLFYMGYCKPPQTQVSLAQKGFASEPVSLIQSSTHCRMMMLCMMMAMADESEMNNRRSDTTDERLFRFQKDIFQDEFNILYTMSSIPMVRQRWHKSNATDELYLEPVCFSGYHLFRWSQHSDKATQSFRSLVRYVYIFFSTVSRLFPRKFGKRGEIITNPDEWDGKQTRYFCRNLIDICAKTLEDRYSDVSFEQDEKRTGDIRYPIWIARRKTGMMISLYQAEQLAHWLNEDKYRFQYPTTEQTERIKLIHWLRTPDLAEENQCLWKRWLGDGMFTNLIDRLMLRDIALEHNHSGNDNHPIIVTTNHDNQEEED